MVTTARPLTSLTPPTWPTCTPAMVTAWPWPGVTAEAFENGACTL